MTIVAHLTRLWRGHAAGKRAASGRPGAFEVAGTEEQPCRYVAIIMDGNGRWAQGRGLPVAAGHRAGAKSLRRIIERALDWDIKELTVFSFSTENWSRPPEEVTALMDLFVETIEREIPGLHKENVRVRFVGRRANAPAKLVKRIEQAEAMTAGNTRMTFFIAFNYGGRAEVTDAVAAMAADMAAGAFADASAGDGGERPVEAGKPADAAFDSEALRPYLYAPDMHDPELLIRTSGEMRISNFLLWQLAYTELYFTPTLWPDMGAADLDEALAEFALRRRRYGGRA